MQGSSTATCKSPNGHWQYGRCPLGQEGGAVKGPGLCRERAGKWSPGLDRGVVTIHGHRGGEDLWLSAEAGPWDQALEMCPHQFGAVTEDTGMGVRTR